MHINILLIESLLLLLYNHGEIQLQATGRSENKKLFCVNSSKQQIDFKFVFEYNFFNSSI